MLASCMLADWQLHLANLLACLQHTPRPSEHMDAASNRVDLADQQRDGIRSPAPSELGESLDRPTSVTLLATEAGPAEPLPGSERVRRAGALLRKCLSLGSEQL